MNTYKQTIAYLNDEQENTMAELLIEVDEAGVLHMELDGSSYYFHNIVQADIFFKAVLDTAKAACRANIEFHKA